jgi:transcriptional regulator with GAF, ATPase, and Fis domain
VVTGALADEVPPAYASSLERLATTLLEGPTLVELLERIVTLTSRAVAGTAAVSVSVVDDDHTPATVAASSAAARDVDDAQYRDGAGPCVEALRTGEERCSDDLTRASSWPAFSARARAHGLTSVLAVPLRVGAEVIGCLNVFTSVEGGLPEEDRATVRRIAAPAAAAVANARARARVDGLTEELRTTLEERALVERAKGVVMGGAACTAEVASALLQDHAEARGVPLVEAAEQVLDTHLAGLRIGSAAPSGAPTVGGGAATGGDQVTSGPDASRPTRWCDPV